MRPVSPTARFAIAPATVEAFGTINVGLFNAGLNKPRFFMDIDEDKVDLIGRLAQKLVDQEATGGIVALDADQGVEKTAFPLRVGAVQLLCFRPFPAADLVRRLDPELFHTALFASEPGRDWLMVLYAFDIELSRAAARSSASTATTVAVFIPIVLWQGEVGELRSSLGEHDTLASELQRKLAAIAQLRPQIPDGSRVLAFNYDSGERYLSVEALWTD